MVDDKQESIDGYSTVKGKFHKNPHYQLLKKIVKKFACWQLLCILTSSKLHFSCNTDVAVEVSMSAINGT